MHVEIHHEKEINGFELEMIVLIVQCENLSDGKKDLECQQWNS